MNPILQRIMDKIAAAEINSALLALRAIDDILDNFTSLIVEAVPSSPFGRQTSIVCPEGVTEIDKELTDALPFLVFPQNKEDVNSLIGAFDRNNDGMISFEDFKSHEAQIWTQICDHFDYDKVRFPSSLCFPFDLC